MFSVSHMALVKTYLLQLWIAPLAATVFMWSQGMKQCRIQRRILVQLVLKYVALEEVYNWS